MFNNCEKLNSSSDSIFNDFSEFLASPLFVECQASRSVYDQVGANTPMNESACILAQHIQGYHQASLQSCFCTHDHTARGSPGPMGHGLYSNQESAQANTLLMTPAPSVIHADLIDWFANSPGATPASSASSGQVFGIPADEGDKHYKISIESCPEPIPNKLSLEIYKPIDQCMEALIDSLNTMSHYSHVHLMLHAPTELDQLCPLLPHMPVPLKTVSITVLQPQMHQHIHHSPTIDFCYFLLMSCPDLSSLWLNGERLTREGLEGVVGVEGWRG